MSRDTSPSSLPLPAATPDRLTSLDRGAATAGAQRQQLGELAAQFESMLMLEMIKQMRKSLLDEQAEGEGLGNETFSSTIDSELSMHLAKAGGLGLSPMMLDAWERQQAAAAPGTTMARTAALPVTAPSSPLAPAATPAAAPTAALPAVSVVRPAAGGGAAARGRDDAPLSLEMGSRVSSAYGWRTDPFGRGAKFHGGIDLAARYGTEVPAAAGGSVVSAGEQGGYGLTVVIQHQNGFESRYAHLSSIDVKAGDAVAAGQQVGRVGSTGRSTGPHLHFEVTQAGRRVDPERFVRKLTSDIKGQ